MMASTARGANRAGMVDRGRPLLWAIQQVARPLADDVVCLRNKAPVIRNERMLSGFHAGSANVVQKRTVDAVKNEPLAEYKRLLDKALKPSVSQPRRQSVQEQEGPNNIKRLNKALARQYLEYAKYKTWEDVVVTTPQLHDGVQAEAGHEASAGAKSFISEAKAAGKTATGRGNSQSEAESVAAGKLLQLLESEGIVKELRRTPTYTLRPPTDAKWIPVPSTRHTLEAVPEKREVPIPELAHGLHRIVAKDRSAATSISHRIGGKGLDKEYFSKIEQPENINWLAIAPFTPSSRDEYLHRLALQHKAKYKASTSSITGLFSHIYQVTSNWRPVDTSDLSDAFKDQPKTFSTTLVKKPVAVLIRPKDGIYGIDSEPEGEQAHQILVNLGKSLERMLTMDTEQFRKLMLKSPEGETFEVPEDITASTYNFSIFGDFMLRSQLDCIYNRENKIFDLKTRATHAIRNSFHVGPKDVDPKDRYKAFISYRITQQQGLYNSFERELYDMIRSAFIKYSLQLRIGRMHGAFVTYHNTQEIFGFQYVPLSYMDKLIFGSSYIANTHFDSAAKILTHILDTVISSFPAGQTIRMSTAPFKHGRYLLIEARPVLAEDVVEGDPATGSDPDHKIVLGEPISWYMWITTQVNGKVVPEPWNFKERDTFETSFAMVRTSEYRPPQPSPKSDAKPEE